MTDRLSLSHKFLMAHGWGAAVRAPLADDASFRRYERLRKGQACAILMDAPPDFEDVRPFVTIAKYLRDIGLAAPKILACDHDHGFLLLEDMGDGLLAKVIDADPTQENRLYALAVRGLLHLHKAPPPKDMTLYEEDLLLQELALFSDWYMPSLTGKPMRSADRAEFLALWQNILPFVTKDLKHLTLRDYHGENLMLKSDGEGLDRLGLLDFQDAVIGHPAYDLVSLLQDARRDVSPDLEREMLQFYLGESGQDPADFTRDYAILGAQRNLKIMGIFTRLFLRDGKAAYLDKISHVWAMLARDLDHPVLGAVKNWMAGHISEPVRRAAPLPKNFMAKKALILAAGLGTRMRPLTENCPKPLITVGGKALLTWSLEALCAAGVRHVVVNMHYLPEQIEHYAQTYYDHRMTITLSDERGQLMDSGGGVKKALCHMGDAAFFVLNSDMIWRDRAAQMLHQMQGFWQDDKMDILMLLVPRLGAFGYDGAGDYNRNNEGRLTARGQDAAADFVYGGIMLITPRCFDGAPDGPFSLRQQFDQAEKESRLFGMIHDGDWYHVGTADARDQLEDILAACPEG